MKVKAFHGSKEDCAKGVTSVFDLFLGWHHELEAVAIGVSTNRAKLSMLLNTLDDEDGPAMTAKLCAFLVLAHPDEKFDAIRKDFLIRIAKEFQPEEIFDVFLNDEGADDSVQEGE